MNYVYATVSYQDGRNIKYADSLGIGRTMGEAEKNLKDTLFKYNPKAKPYYNDIYDAQSHHQNYDFELEDVFTELRGLDKHPELMQILLDYLPRAITQRLPGVKVVSDATTETTPNGFKVSVDLMDKNGNKFTLDVGYGGNPGIHVSIFSKEDNRYVSDTARGYPPKCPDIKKLLDQYYKHLNNESLTNKRRQPILRNSPLRWFKTPAITETLLMASKKICTSISTRVAITRFPETLNESTGLGMTTIRTVSSSMNSVRSCLTASTMRTLKNFLLGALIGSSRHSVLSVSHTNSVI